MGDILILLSIVLMALMILITHEEISKVQQSISNLENHLIRK